jgi:lipoate-protein ligase A
VTRLVCWWDEDADGPVNMATDEALALEAERTRAVLVRLYRWTRTTLSLGGFQPVSHARGHAALAGLPLVRRPSGGGAIIHGSDLTYAVAVPKEHPWGRSAQALYDAFHGAFVAELEAQGVAARLHEAAATAVSPPAGGLEAEAFLCFDRRAAGDVVVAPDARAGSASHASADSKVLGSAQRRLAGVILQHGSLLWQANPDVPSGCRHPGLVDLTASMCRGDLGDLARRWLHRVARCLGGGLEERGQFAAGREAEIDRLQARFLDDRWTARR